jgi:transposase
MDLHHPRCAGLDVHKEQVTGTIRVTPEQGRPHAHKREFATTPVGLAGMRAWIQEHGVTHVAMEGTGIYWIPVYTALESVPGLDLTLCNAHHVKNVPGRKTDVSDSAWLANLLSAGLLRKSFVPPADVRDLRMFTRARVHRVEDRSRVLNEIHRLLEGEGIKLCAIVSDLSGVTSLAILRALLSGETNPLVLAEMARGKLRNKRAELAAVLAAPLRAPARDLLRDDLARFDLLDAQITDLDARIAKRMVPYQAELDLLTSIKGLDVVAASAILAEIGVDMKVFTDAHHLAAWAGLSPGQHVSAGKSKGGKPRPGNPYVQRVLVQIAWVIARCKTHDLYGFFKSKAFARGPKKAAVAVAHKVLRRIFAMLTDAKPYTPPMPPTLPEAKRQRRVFRHLAALKALGYTAEIHPLATGTECS